jgi:imidazoleglycerol phosphate dehydratase HisB
MKRDVPKLIIEIEEDLQKQIKHKIADEGITIKEFVTNAIKDKLKNG